VLSNHGLNNEEKSRQQRKMSLAAPVEPALIDLTRTPDRRQDVKTYELNLN
jgi:hypothetical protein